MFEKSYIYWNTVWKKISHNPVLFIQKLLEPIIEIESRRNRIVIYLFEKQLINTNTNKFIEFYLNMRYLRHLAKLRLIRKRKIRIGFLVTEIQKWTCRSFYEAVENSSVFEPVILLGLSKNACGDNKVHERYKNNEKFFKRLNYRYCRVYDVESKTHLPIKNFNIDILFYQQPWSIPSIQGILETSKSALTCYIPYCFYSMDSFYNYLMGFHGRLWKYFVESEFHKTDYEKSYHAGNCVVSGSVKLDNYKYINCELNSCKTREKQSIIYAPHHSFESDVDHAVATFAQNGDFILELAKAHPEFNWIFRPHPVFRDKVIKQHIKTEEEIELYYQEWGNIGKISGEKDNYYEEFINSDCLITDCISFLAEYLPTQKPVIHLRSERQLCPFNNLMTQVTDSYYKVYDNESLSKTFDEVMIKKNDYKKEQRTGVIRLLHTDRSNTAGEKIKEYLEKELWLRK